MMNEKVTKENESDSIVIKKEVKIKDEKKKSSGNVRKWNGENMKQNNRRKKRTSLNVGSLTDETISFPTRVIWGLFLVISTCLCIFMVMNNIIEFQRYEVFFNLYLTIKFK